MGWFSGITSALGALNPVGLLGTAASVAGPIVGAIAQNQTNQINKGIANQSYDFQTMQLQDELDLAKNGIQYRVADAQKAGIAPLAALGASTPQISPVGSPIDPGYTSPLMPFSQGLSDMGQNIGRALMAGSPVNTRSAAIMDQLAVHDSETRSKILDLQYSNALWESQHRVPPAVPTSSDTPIPAFQKYRNRDGTIFWAPSADYSQASHAMPWGASIPWFFSNKLMPDMNIQNFGQVGSGGSYFRPRYLGGY